MSEWTDADVETVREALRGAKCTCGHDAEWHSGMLGCNAEDYTDPPTACECTEDWVGAVVPSLVSGVVVPARLVEEAERNLDPAYKDIETCACLTPGWTHHTGFHDFVEHRERRAAARAESRLRSAVEALADPHGPNYTLYAMRQNLAALLTEGRDRAGEGAGS